MGNAEKLSRYMEIICGAKGLFPSVKLLHWPKDGRDGDFSLCQHFIHALVLPTSFSANHV